MWGLERLRFSSPFQHLHGHSHQQAAAEPNALAKAFVETLKTIPESLTGRRAIERHPGRTEDGVKPRCGGQEQCFAGNLGRVDSKSVYALHPYFLQSLGWRVRSGLWEGSLHTATDHQVGSLLNQLSSEGAADSWYLSSEPKLERWSQYGGGATGDQLGTGVNA